jgi:tetratricopeptide (TPR) repeat protein
MKRLLSLAIASSAVASLPVVAQSAADALLKAAGPTAAAGSTPSAGVVASFGQEEIRLNSPIARQLFAEWTAAQGKNNAVAFETGTWVRFVLSEKFEAAAHLWSTLQNKFPDSISETAKAAHLYGLYKLGLHQTFFDQWMDALATRRFPESRGATALEESIAPEFEAWFLDHAVQISADAGSVIRKLGPERGSIFVSLTAAMLERKGEAATAFLPTLPVTSRFRPRLAQTVAAALARKGDLAGAGTVLKTYYEPWLATVKDPEKVSSHYLQIARLLYQAGSFEGAIQYYEKVPTGSVDYLTAREELAWCWLRLGDGGKLRGNLSTLTSKLLADRFQPEAYLVRAISNLKLCYHAEVEKDFDSFLKSNQVWASKIQNALKAADPTAPRLSDLYSTRAVLAEKQRQAEITVLEGLAERSIAAVLPAVGPQKHWTEALQKSKLNLESARKLRVSEYRRQWKNDQAALLEAIRKMQFVKVELLSQVTLAAAEQKDVEGTKVALAAASGTAPDVAAARAQIRNDGDMVFPFDGVVWPDELFKLRSQSTSRCLGQL